MNMRFFPGANRFLIIVLFIAVCISSCTTPKKLRYFQDLPDSEIVDLPPAPQEERLIEYGDQLDISFSGKDPEAALFFTRKGVPATLGEPGQIVDPLGFIEFPMLGKIKVYGLTARQLKNKLTELASPYMKEAMVDVRFISFRLSVLGEVRSPGTFTMPQQRTSILDALAAAGDLPITAKRYDIQLYRQANGKRSITKIDLRKKAVLLDNETFQMRHGDILIVPPRTNTILQQETGVITTVLGLIISVIGIVVILNRNN
ncbi:MAG TPA: polysaccharide biosynthesis/export family protein [Flavitalea sp.]|nr:polysaccharide biosynthesis/export family protein [Flavitalea sp.]